MSDKKPNRLRIYEIIPETLFFVRSCLAWILLRLFGIRCTFKEVNKGKYFSDNTQLNLPSTGIKSSDKILELSKEIYKEENDRRSSVSNKCKVLLTISTVLLAVASLMLQNMSFSFITLLPILFIFLTVFMLLIYFDVGSYNHPYVDEEMPKREPEKFNTELSKNYFLCAEQNRLAHDFLVDVYRVAKNSLLIGMILMICCFIIYVNFPAYFTPAANTTKSATTSMVSSQSPLDAIPARESNKTGGLTLDHESVIHQAMSEIYHLPLIGWITTIVGILLFLVGVISGIYLYIFPTAKLGYLFTALWATIPPMWFMLEYNVLYRCYGIHTTEVLKHFKYNQRLAAAIWVGIGAVLGAELLVRRVNKESNN